MTRRRGQLDREGDRAAVDVDRLDHPQRDQVASDLGILDPPKGGHDVLVGEHFSHTKLETSFRYRCVGAA